MLQPIRQRVVLTPARRQVCRQRQKADVVTLTVGEEGADFGWEQDDDVRPGICHGEGVIAAYFVAAKRRCLLGLALAKIAYLLWRQEFIIIVYLKMTVAP